VLLTTRRTHATASIAPGDDGQAGRRANDQFEHDCARERRGETLSIAQSGPAVAGQAVNFLATGQQTGVNDYAGGFSLEVFEKDPTVDPTCAASYWDETNNEITDPSELHFIIGDLQGTDTTFSVPFKAVLEKPGPVLLCAYSTWITDTAASATLT
jgi:hypothetical protein